MKLADLQPDVIEKLRPWRYDRILEKHEGPFDWGDAFKYEDPEFLEVEGHPVLLPVPRDQHPNIRILRAISSRDGQSLTLFLKDLTYARDPTDEMFSGGFMAVCDRFPGHDFFVATVYHEWFIVENPPQ